jgi:hypothetical protein
MPMVVVMAPPQNVAIGATYLYLKAPCPSKENAQGAVQKIKIFQTGAACMEG